MLQWLQTILKNLVFQVSYAPNTIYKYSQHTIDIIKANHLTRFVNNIAAPIHYLHQQYDILNIDPVKLKHKTQSAYIGVKRSTGPLLKWH